MNPLPTQEDDPGPHPRAIAVRQRDHYRKLLHAERDGQLIRLDQVQPSRMAYQNGDRAENLVDGPADQLVRTLEEMEARGMLRAKLAESPWSDWYWPTYQGLLGARYNDPQFPLDSEDWQAKRDYVEARPALPIVQSGDLEAINRLSPAEKYDLLIGDRDGHLTQSMWAEGQAYYDQDGKVERWMGLCHGWAQASYMMARPTHAVELLAADGKTKLWWYISDLKGLGSLLWARCHPAVRFIGGRCNDKEPTTDASGRILSQQCFDSNPGTFHLTLVNQLGIRRRSFISDATYDYEVWNFPVYSYEYTYFNPQTGKPVHSLAEAKVARSAFASDRFAQYRADNARYIVGCKLTLTYVSPTMPEAAATDSPQNDYRRNVHYTYDLELAEDGTIIGGEWYLNDHPDFLWTPAPGAVSKSSAESIAVGSWAGGPLPDAWRRAAVVAARRGQPLGKLVGALFQLSQAPPR